MKVFSILLLFVVIANCSHCQQLSKEETIQVNVSAKAFLALIEEYSNCKGATAKDNLSGEILASKDETDATDFICNDLFPEVTTNFEDNLNWFQYLTYVESYFNYNIDIINDNNKIIDCRLLIDGNSYALYEVDKALNFKDKSLNQKIILVINLKNFKIKEIVSTLFFSTHNTACTLFTQDNDEQLKKLRSQADIYYSKGDYNKALNVYNTITQNDASDLLAKTRYEDCKTKISYMELLAKANADFDNRDYELASNEYANILNSYNEANRNILKQKIEQCKIGITELNFQKNVQLGDHYFSIANFEQARFYYSEALRIKPGDNGALAKLEKSKHGDRSYALGEIKRAERLAESSRKNFGETFAILSEYEPSGLLSIKNYIFLTLMMDEKNGNVKEQMHYNNRNCFNYLRIYSKKLYYAVQTESDQDLKELGAKILDRVINSRYQK